MTNVFALGLLLASLMTSGVLSPTHEEKQKNSGEDVIVKEGQRVVVVEFEKDYGSTKISISPHDSQATYDQVDENAKEKLSEKMENGKEKLIEEDRIHRGFSPKELVCDAYGKCKRRIECAMGKANEKGVAEKVHEGEDMAYEVEEVAREAASEAIGKVKDMASDTAHWTSDKAREAEERATDAAYKTSDKAREAKEGLKDPASEAKDKFSEGAGEMKDGVKEGAEEMVENASKRAKNGAHEVKEGGKKELSDILRRAREVAFDLFEYVIASPVSTAFNALHLLGFAAAYGMCVWVTFASSYVLASALPRHQFGIVQSKIYPVYFKAMTYSVGMALLGHLMSNQRNRKVSPNNIGAGIFQDFNLMMSIVMILVNLLYLQPRATKLMFERMEEEKEEGRGKETERAGRSTATEEKPEILVMRKSQMLNSCCYFLNFMTLMSLTCHLLHLGRRLHASC